MSGKSCFVGNPSAEEWKRLRGVCMQIRRLYLSRAQPHIQTGTSSSHVYIYMNRFRCNVLSHLLCFSSESHAVLQESYDLGDSQPEAAADLLTESNDQSTGPPPALETFGFSLSLHTGLRSAGLNLNTRDERL